MDPRMLTLQNMGPDDEWLDVTGQIWTDSTSQLSNTLEPANCGTWGTTPTDPASNHDDYPEWVLSLGFPLDAELTPQDLTERQLDVAVEGKTDIIPPFQDYFAPPSEPSHQHFDTTQTDTDNNDKPSRERNRIASSRHRQKEKTKLENLEETVAQLDAKHSRMLAEYNHLRNEVSKMKELLLAHAGCNNYEINEWIRQQAARYLEA